MFECGAVTADRRPAPAERAVQEAPAVVKKTAEPGLGAPESARPRDSAAFCRVWGRVVWPRLYANKDSVISSRRRHTRYLEHCLISSLGREVRWIKRQREK